MVDPHHPCQCQPNAETLPWLLLHPCPYEGWAHKTPMPRHHWASSRLACFTLSVSSTPPRTSSTKVSSAKQSSCGDGPAENTATSQSSSLPRRSSRTTFRKNATNSQDTELMSLHFSLARACHARHQNRFSRHFSSAYTRGLDDSSTRMWVLSQIHIRPTADASDTWVLQFSKHLDGQ